MLVSFLKIIRENEVLSFDLFKLQPLKYTIQCKLFKKSPGLVQVGVPYYRMTKTFYVGYCW